MCCAQSCTNHVQHIGHVSHGTMWYTYVRDYYSVAQDFKSPPELTVCLYVQLEPIFKNHGITVNTRTRARDAFLSDVIVEEVVTAADPVDVTQQTTLAGRGHSTVDDCGSRPAHSPVKLWQPLHRLSIGRVGTVGTHQRDGMFDCLNQLENNVLVPGLSFIQ